MRKDCRIKLAGMDPMISRWEKLSTAGAAQSRNNTDDKYTNDPLKPNPSQFSVVAEGLGAAEPVWLHWSRVGGKDMETMWDVKPSR